MAGPLFAVVFRPKDTVLAVGNAIFVISSSQLDTALKIRTSEISIASGTIVFALADCPLHVPSTVRRPYGVPKQSG